MGLEVRLLKDYLGTVPLLSKPVTGESLYIYLSVSETAVSSALIRKVDLDELPAYYTSKGFIESETRYPDIKKLALALIISARRLRY